MKEIRKGGEEDQSMETGMTTKTLKESHYLYKHVEKHFSVTDHKKKIWCDIRAEIGKPYLTDWLGKKQVPIEVRENAIKA